MAKTLKEELKEKIGEYPPKTLDIDTFSKIIEEFLVKQDVKLLIEMPEGTNEAKYSLNIGGGPVIGWFILLNAMKPVIMDVISYFDNTEGTADIDGLIDSMMEIAGEDIKKALKEEGFGQRKEGRG